MLAAPGLSPFFGPVADPCADRPHDGQDNETDNDIDKTIASSDAGVQQARDPELKFIHRPGRCLTREARQSQRTAPQLPGSLWKFTMNIELVSAW